MDIYRLELTLMEKVFFASREIDDLFQTEPVLSNYALSYALGLVASPYRLTEREDRPYYREDLSPLNEQGIYVSPGTPLGTPSLEVERFNGMVDSYWYKMAPNVVVAELSARFGARVRPTNFPQNGRLRILARGNRFFCFVCSNDAYTPPQYIRLGKFMSKVRIETVETWHDPPVSHVQQKRLTCFLNPLDLDRQLEIGTYDLFNLPPVPLIRNAQVTGDVYVLGNDNLPVNMHYGLPEPAPAPRGGRRRRRRA